MTLAHPSDQLTAGAPKRRRSAAREGRAPGRTPIGYLFVSLYALLTLAFGIAPAVYTVVLAFTTGDGGFAGFDNFVKVVTDFRFWPAVLHVVAYLVIWLIGLLIFVVALALIVHAIRARWASTTLRFVYYLPGALAGASSVLLWLFVLDPTASPVSGLLRAMGFNSFVQVIQPGNLPVIFAVIAFWTGAGGWIVIMYGALNNIPRELIEAAEIDGSNAFQTALRIKLPLIRKWIVYMLVLSFAAGSQLFVEPQILGVATVGEISPQWSPNQLAYYLAFQLDRFNDAAAISVDLLVIGLLVAVLLVWRGKLFEVD